MKKLFLATTAVVALAAGSATAADLAVKARPLPPPPPPCSQFGGFYIGGNVGWGFSEHRRHDRDGFAAHVSPFGLPLEHNLHQSGFVGGVQGGYNWQFRCTLFGIEADYQWMANRHDRDHTTGILFPGTTMSVHHRHESFGTVRARSGVIVDNLLLYVTGGFAYARHNHGFEVASPTTTIGPFPIAESFDHRKTRWGWTFGVGTEWAIWDNWSVKSEVLYARFERHENQFFSPTFQTNFRFDHHDQVWVTRIGLNYRFGGYGAGPVAARY